PILGAVNPGCFFLVVALAVAVLFSVGHCKIDNILAVNRVNNAIFTQIADYLHFNHSAQKLNRKKNLMVQDTENWTEISDVFGRKNVNRQHSICVLICRKNQCTNQSLAWPKLAKKMIIC
ncbi:MAG TPA: hypothetical protein VD905_13375, partial [Flavobacteriales bacterium]|nr:hypothetical protein [Flavobacteriales bacterium]